MSRAIVPVLIAILGAACGTPDIKAPITADAKPSSCVQVDGASLVTGICLARVERGWRRDFTRVTLQLKSGVGCVRVEQPGENDLGYDEAGDSPDRAYLEIDPRLGAPSFTVDEDPGSGEPITMLNKLVKALDGPVRIDVYNASCAETLVGSGSVSIHLLERGDVRVQNHAQETRRRDPESPSKPSSAATAAPNGSAPRGRRDRPYRWGHTNDGARSAVNR